MQGLALVWARKKSHDSIASIDPAMERSMDAEMPGEAPSSSAVALSSRCGLCGREVEPAPTTSRSVGPRLHATPKTVKDCRINKNDHRFQVSMDKKAEKHETWIDVYAQKYFSAGFQAHSGWRQALQQAHSWMWTKWELANMPLPEGKVRKKPGEVPEDVIASLQDELDSLPPKKKCIAKSELTTFGFEQCYPTKAHKWPKWS